jgi:hypothetical protein
MLQASAIRRQAEIEPIGEEAYHEDPRIGLTI